MKNTTKHLLLFITIAISTFNTNAQKIAHINYDSLLAKMPERKAAETIYQAYVDSIKLNLKQREDKALAMANQLKIELENKEELNREQEARAQETEMLVRDLEKYMAKVKLNIETKSSELLDPITAKAKNAINQVAKENNYNLVIDSSKDTYLYIQGIQDIMPLVLKKLYNSTLAK